MPGGQRLQAGQGAQSRGLAGAVGAEQRDDLAGVYPQGHIEVERAEVDDQADVEQRGHGLLIHLSRSAARIVTDTDSRIRLSTTAALRSVSRAR